MQIRSSDVWLKSDLFNILLALARTAQTAGGDYSRGYSDAIAAVATALGITPSDVVDILDRRQYW
jgi:hypothetical protein